MKIDGFVLLVAAAIALLVVLSLISGSFTFYQPQGFQVLESFSLGTVGFSQETILQNIQLGDLKVGEVQEEKLKEVLQMEISQGIAGGNSEELNVLVPESLLEQSRGVKVSFSVLEANPIGNLRVQWNGDEVYSAKPSGLTEFKIGREKVKASNTIELKADGPGLQVYTSTSYKVTNFQVLHLTGPQKPVPFQIKPSELQRFDRGEVQFFGSGSGKLDVKINGVSIFSDIPAGPEKTSFDMTTVPLNAGNNVLTFVSTGTNTLSGAGLKIFGIGNELVKTRKFTLEPGDVNSLDRGKPRILVVVDRVIKNGLLDVKINGKGIASQALGEGNNTVSFKGSDVEEGENRITFTGSGAWEIPEVKIGFEIA